MPTSQISCSVAFANWSGLNLFDLRPQFQRTPLTGLDAVPPGFTFSKGAASAAPRAFRGLCKKGQPGQFHLSRKLHHWLKKGSTGRSLMVATCFRAATVRERSVG